MTTPGTPGNITYQVVGISAGQYGEDAAGNTIQGHIVYFKLGNGPQSQVFVPDTTFPDAEAVAALVKSAAQNLHNVNSISGSLD